MPGHNNVYPANGTNFKKELPESLTRLGWLMFIAGIVLGAIGFFLEPERAAFSYLSSFMFLLSIGIGSLFLVALEYLAGADWSVPFRRISEFLSSVTPLLLIVSIPLLFNISDLFHWSHPEVVAEDEVLRGKSPYLNVPFFLIRVVVIFGIWSLFYFLFTKNSRNQDITKDQSLTKRNIVMSAIFIPLFAISVTVAAVDWMMSLEPHWFSTVFGVYFFSGSVWGSLAALTLIVILLKEKGYLHPALKEDHYYSLGTLLFAFTCFWGYIAFSQYMLIWYADLPEENFWFLHRWSGGWEYFSLLLIVSHFIIPFGALLSYNSKTNPGRLKFISVWILAAHFLDLYWVIMPNMFAEGQGYFFSWIDFVFLVAVVGLIIVMFTVNAKKYNLVPIGDPKLQRGLDFTLH